MHRILLLVGLMTSLALSASNEVKVNMTADAATVFLNGAQVFHSKTVSLPAGASEVIIEGISGTLVDNSIQAGGNGKFTILDVQFRFFYPEPVQTGELPVAVQKKIKDVEDSILNTAFNYKALLARRESLNLQKQMLTNYELLKNGGKNDSLELLRQSIEYYNISLDKILIELIGLERTELTIQKEQQRLQQRLVDLNNYYQQQYPQQDNTPVPQIVLTVEAPQATSAFIEINYLTYSAGWFATYDIKATDIGQPVRLTYKANVWQNSGIEWDNIQLTCSTGNPLIGNDPPQLTTWYLNYYEYVYQTYSNAGAAAAIQTDEVAMDRSYLEDLDKATTSAGITTQQANITQMEFSIKTKYSIPSNGRSRSISIKEEMLKADYNYLVIPKLDPSAFLLARITGWEEHGYLPGNANIYFCNTLIGKSLINTLTMSDTLSISLGRDNGIQVSRKVLKDKSSDKFIGANRRVERVHEIEVRNNKPLGVEIIIMDQIPVSQQGEIKVEVGDLSKGELNEYTGIITWRDKIRSKGSSKFQFSFIVTYPKDKVVTL